VNTVSPAIRLKVLFPDMARTADHEHWHHSIHQCPIDYSQSESKLDDTHYAFLSSSLTKQPYFTTNVDLHALAHSINLAATQPSKRKSEGQYPGHASKKQKNADTEYISVGQHPFVGIRPIGTPAGQEPLTHVKRWRMHTWHWPKKIRKSPPAMRKSQGKKTFTSEN
jgi:hypothetical protein